MTMANCGTILSGHISEKGYRPHYPEVGVVCTGKVRGSGSWLPPGM